MFSHLYTFYFLCIVALAKTFDPMLSKSGEGRHPCLVSDLRGKSFRVSPLSIMLAVGFYRFFLSHWSSSFYSYFTENFMNMKHFISCFMNEYWILSKFFSAPVNITMWFSLFDLLTSGYNCFSSTEPALHPWNKLHLCHGI